MDLSLGVYTCIWLYSCIRYTRLNKQRLLEATRVQSLILRIIYQKNAPMGLSYTYKKMESSCHQNNKEGYTRQYAKFFIITKQKEEKELSVGTSMLQLRWLLHPLLLSHEYHHRDTISTQQSVESRSPTLSF